jgi:hypothetical protein
VNTSIDVIEDNGKFENALRMNTYSLASPLRSREVQIFADRPRESTTF